MLVDSHCHLDFPEFDADRDAVVERAGDVLIINSTVDPELVEKALSMASRHRNVRLTFGFSASETDEGKYEAMKAAIRANRGAIVGLGEVGLDYHWVKDEAGRETERRHFRELAALSLDLSLPLVVHSRDAEAECINILRELKVRAMMHCFSGTREQAIEAVGLGCLISVPTSVVNSKQKQRLAAAVPLESLVLETDAPFLSPVKGERNEPANVRRAAEKVAEVKGLAASKVADAAAENALRFFNARW